MCDLRKLLEAAIKLTLCTDLCYMSSKVILECDVSCLIEVRASVP